MTEKCCFFMCFRRQSAASPAISVISFTPQALALVERNALKAPLAAIPRQLKVATPLDDKKPLSVSAASTSVRSTTPLA